MAEQQKRSHSSAGIFQPEPGCTGKKGLRAGLAGVFSRPFFSKTEPHSIMSQHRSLKTAGSVGTKRSVLKRGERIKLLKSRGQWQEGRLPTNLPKTKPE